MSRRARKDLPGCLNGLDGVGDEMSPGRGPVACRPSTAAAPEGSGTPDVSSGTRGEQWASDALGCPTPPTPPDDKAARRRRRKYFSGRRRWVNRLMGEGKIPVTRDRALIPGDPLTVAMNPDLYGFVPCVPAEQAVPACSPVGQPGHPDAIASGGGAVTASRLLVDSPRAAGSTAYDLTDACGDLTEHGWAVASDHWEVDPEGDE